MKSTFGPNDENGVKCAKYAVVEIGYYTLPKHVAFGCNSCTRALCFIKQTCLILLSPRAPSLNALLLSRPCFFHDERH